jgi:hypothetical protein
MLSLVAMSYSMLPELSIMNSILALPVTPPPAGGDLTAKTFAEANRKKMDANFK